MSAKLIKATNMTSSFSKREKMRRKPLSRRTAVRSLAPLVHGALYSHAVTRFCLGERRDEPKIERHCRVSSPS